MNYKMGQLVLQSGAIITKQNSKIYLAADSLSLKTWIFVTIINQTPFTDVLASLGRLRNNPSKVFQFLENI